MVKMTGRDCNRKRPKRRRTTISMTIDPHIFGGLKKWMKKSGETNTSAVIEGFIDCGIRDTCEECPFAEDPNQEKVGVGKIA